jgi:hypothetical protein
MAKLTIKKRGHSWVLLEGRLGIDAFPTKARALDEKRLRKLWAGWRTAARVAARRSEANAA